MVINLYPKLLNSSYHSKENTDDFYKIEGILHFKSVMYLCLNV